MVFYRFIHRGAYVQEQFRLLQKSHQARRCYRSLPWFSAPINGSGSRKSHQTNGNINLLFFTMLLCTKANYMKSQNPDKKKSFQKFKICEVLDIFGFDCFTEVWI